LTDNLILVILLLARCAEPGTDADEWECWDVPLKPFISPISLTAAVLEFSKQEGWCVKFFDRLAEG
jgi:hypothetical protein